MNTNLVNQYEKNLQSYTCMLYAINVCICPKHHSIYLGPNPPILQECNFAGDPTGHKFAPAPYTYFTVTSKKDNDTFIARESIAGKTDGDSVRITDQAKFLQLNIATSQQENFSKSSRNAYSLSWVNDNRKYFIIPAALLGTATAIPVYAKGCKSAQLTISATTLPFKLRIHNFDFAKDLNVGSVIGMNVSTNRIKNNFINYLFNISVSVNDIDKQTARGVPDDQLPAKNIAALTLAGGILWQSGKAQFGIFYGFDFMSHENWVKYRWVYNKGPWIGIGFGINLFQKEYLNASPADEISNAK